ncbi:hypothetical protein [Actinophytocola sp.]|uniref:hypothetical protein n=1 Tax=Actinophytocola sp. TaxID=1872138 RepID=UPI00389AB38F
MSQNKPVASITDLLRGITDDLAGVFGQMEWAEDEIAQARRGHPAEADTLYHSFLLLKPTHELMDTEFVYRSHCRELLERVAAGRDTRPGTAAEICCACCDSSQLAPLTSPAAGLYHRMWVAAFPDKPNFFAEHQQAHEVLEGSTIDDLEATMRRKLAVQDRTLGAIDCHGRHHGEPVQCQYSTVAEAA